MTYSFLPIDIGFDPRMQGMPVRLPTDATAVRVDSARGVITVSGTRAVLLRTLRQAGFEVFR